MTEQQRATSASRHRGRRVRRPLRAARDDGDDDDDDDGDDDDDDGGDDDDGDDDEATTTTTKRRRDDEGGDGRSFRFRERADRPPPRQRWRPRHSARRDENAPLEEARDLDGELGLEGRFHLSVTRRGRARRGAAARGEATRVNGEPVLRDRFSRPPETVSRCE